MRKLLLSASAMLIGWGAAPALAQEAIAIGADVDAGTLDSRLSRDTTAFRIADLIYSGLVQLTPELEPVPDLAESWETPEPTVFIFKLREGLKFSDGTPLTADDVVFTFSTIVNPDFNSPMRTLYLPIDSVEKIDDRTVKFNLSTPYAPLLSYLDVGIVPKKLVEGGLDIGSTPVGAGPMKLASWTRGAEIRLEANPDYWAGAPKVEKVTIKVIPDNSARAQAFEAGDLDVIQTPLSPQDVGRLAADSRFGNVVIPGLGITYINFNTKDPLLSDPKMRQALAKLVDQKTIIEDIYQGVDEVAQSLIRPSSWAYSADIRQPTFDIEGGVKMLNDLGWTDSDGDGLLDKDGKKLTVTLATHSEDPNRVQAVEFMQAVFSQAGVDAQAQITDWPSFYTNYVQKSQHQMALLGWLNVVDPDRLLYAQLSTGGSSNWGGYSNPKVDELLEGGRSRLSRPERTAAYQEAAKILAEELPYFVVSYQGYQLFYSKSLTDGIAASPRGYLRGLIGMRK